MNQFVLFCLLAGLAQGASLNDIDQITEFSSGIPTAVTFSDSDDDTPHVHNNAHPINVHPTNNDYPGHNEPTSYSIQCGTPEL